MLTFAFIEENCNGLASCLPRLGHIQTEFRKIGRGLYDITLAGAQREINVCAVKVAMRYVREKILVRHDSLRSPNTMF